MYWIYKVVFDWPIHLAICCLACPASAYQLNSATPLLYWPHALSILGKLYSQFYVTYCCPDNHQRVDSKQISAIGGFFLVFFFIRVKSQVRQIIIDG